ARAFKTSGVITDIARISSRPNFNLPWASSTARYEPVGCPLARTTPLTSTPAYHAAAQIWSPTSLYPPAELNETGWPRRARFSATLRAAPPNDRRILAGLDVPLFKAPRTRPTASSPAAPITSTGASGEGENGSLSMALRLYRSFVDRTASI